MLFAGLLMRSNGFGSPTKSGTRSITVRQAYALRPRGEADTISNVSGRWQTHFRGYGNDCVAVENTEVYMKTIVCGLVGWPGLSAFPVIWPLVNHFIPNPPYRDPFKRYKYM
jgi:hypothetical protein